jgi:hypothetical protein
MWICERETDLVMLGDKKREQDKYKWEFEKKRIIVCVKEPDKEIVLYFNIVLTFLWFEINFCYETSTV